ncbi:hypothetical protein JXA80_01585, partial [bacterium]|nr:hypothetical protein [candidate division CSSED10-310 bacterium]
DGGISGSGDIVRIDYRAVKTGQSPLDFSHEAVLDPQAAALPARFTGARVSVTTHQNPRIR